MMRRSIVFAVLTAMSLLCPAAQAAGISVITDSGELSSFTLQNTGVSGGVSTLTLTLTDPTHEVLTTVNGAVVNIPASFTSSITLDVTTLGGGLYSISCATYSKTFGTGGTSSEAVLTANVITGFTFGDFFDLTGHVTGVTSDNLPGYSFSPFLGGNSVNNIALTATRYVGAPHMAGVIATSGASATGERCVLRKLRSRAGLAHLAGHWSQRVYCYPPHVQASPDRLIGTQFAHLAIFPRRRPSLSRQAPGVGSRSFG